MSDERSAGDDNFTHLVADDAVMKRAVLSFARRVTERRGLVLGIYAEALVAEILDAELSPGGTDEADVVWSASELDRTLAIQVKSCSNATALTGSVNIAPPRVRKKDRTDDAAPLPRRGDVWVFAVPSSGEADPLSEGWRFAVTAAAELDERFKGQKSVSLRKLVSADGWTDRSGLGERVIAAAGWEPGRTTVPV